MNIVMIGPFAFRPKGTVSARALPMGRVLASRGHRVTILMPPYDNLADSGRVWEEDGVRLENLRIRRNDVWHQVAVPLRMARRALQLQPDLVHVFKPVGYSGLAGMFLRWLTSMPLVVDTDDWEGRGGWSDVNPYPTLWKWFFGWQERFLLRHARAVTVASRTLQTQAWGLGVEPGRVVYLPNGPDPALRAVSEASDEQKAEIRANLGLGDAPFALYLGHIPHGTDLDLAIDAWAIVTRDLPDARLVIAGEGDGLTELKRLAQVRGVADRVLFPGWIDHKQAPLFLAAADVAVNPYRDTLINRAKCAGKVVAAMAAGKAVITSRVGENLEYIEDGRSGVLTEPGDAQDLARALLRALRAPEWCRMLGGNARQRIWGRFGWEARVEEIERAYQIGLEAARRRA